MLSWVKSTVLGTTLAFLLGTLSVAPTFALVLFQGPAAPTNIVVVGGRLPRVTNVSPSTGAVGATVTITGTGFSTPQASGTVSFNGTAVTAYTSWSATSIVVTVPSGATTGNIVVTQAGVSSTGSSFTVTGGAFTDSPTGKWASTSGSGTTCSSASPCTLATAITQAGSGGTVIVNSGTYTAVDLGTTNQTITATAAVKNALTETCSRIAWLTTIISTANGGVTGCGTFTGTDNRPLWTGAFGINASGITFEWMRVRMAAARAEDGGEAIGVHAENVAVKYTEIFNGGQGMFIWVKRNVTVTHNYIHALGTKGTEFDTHNVGICGSGTESTSFATQIYIGYNTFQDGGGDAVQEQTNAYCTGTFSYLNVEANYMTDFDEQCGDMKGTRFLKWHWNDCSVAPLGGVNATDDPAVTNKTNWDIWDNYFHDIVYWAVGWSQSNDCSAWRIWNNVIARTVTNPPFNAAAINLCGDAGSYVVFNTFVDNTNGNASPRSWGVYNLGSGNNLRNNIGYRNGTGTDDRRFFSAISGEDSGTPNTNYISPNDTNGGLATIGTGSISTCFVANNCPGFTNISTNDFTLQSGSPAVNVGLGIGSHASLTASGNFTPGVDITGKTRDANPDLGAFER